MTDRAYKAWLVDLDGTLYEAFWVKVAMAAELCIGGFKAVSVLRRFRSEHERLRVDPALEATSPFAAQLERTASALGLEVPAVERLVLAWMFERPGKYLRLFCRRRLIQEINRFRDAGGKTALVSDYPAKSKLLALGCSSLFDTVVASGEPGGPPRLKPAPDGFLLAAKRLEVEPADCLVIGDRQDVDGAAAEAAGMAFRLIR
jgi:phosphoglycolate phosphatase/putative hydrolase of the HAD superfamily